MSVCPICGNRDGRVLYSVGSDTAARRFGEGSDEPHVSDVRSAIEAIWGRRSCDYVCCPQCSFAFADPFVAATPAFYAELYDSDSGYAEWRWEFQRTFDVLRMLAATGDLRAFTLLDVGAGAGGFASRILSEIADCRDLLCTEYSEYGRDRIRRRGIRCVQGGLNDVDVQEHRHAFDVICLFQVLEHMNDLEAVFCRLSLLARDTGHLFIAVPNHAQRAYFDKWGFHEDMPPVHIGRWTRQSLEIIANRHGWRLEEDETEPAPYVSVLSRFTVEYCRSSSPFAALGRVKQRHVRRALRSVLVAAFLLTSLPAVYGLRSQNFGSAYWVHLSKK